MVRIVDFLFSVLEPGFGKKNNFGEEKLWIRVWNEDSQLVEEVLLENEQEWAEFVVNSYNKTDHEGSDVVCECLSAEWGGHCSDYTTHAGGSKLLHAKGFMSNWSDD